MPGGKKKTSRLEANAAAPGELFKLRFPGRAFEDKASEELADNMTGSSDSHELELGFKRPSSRLRQGGPEVSALFPDSLSRCAAPARLPYKMF